MMVVETPRRLRDALAPMHGSKRIALIPTMGCLHAGHASLMRKAGELADVVVVSIYVNPLQFGLNEDLDAYPRTLEADKTVCEAAGVDIIFHPENLYASDAPKITLKVTELSDILCGAARSGHFDGVATVVNILFNIVQPDIALFGEKDWQQLAIIRRMATDLHMRVKIVGCKTVREQDGLAMSSRNRYLSAEERTRAVALHVGIQEIADKVKKGEKNCKKLLEIARNSLKVNRINPEYLEIRDDSTLKGITRITNRPARALIAATIGKARLIDNISLHYS